MVSAAAKSTHPAPRPSTWLQEVEITYVTISVVLASRYDYHRLLNDQGVTDHNKGQKEPGQGREKERGYSEKQRRRHRYNSRTPKVNS